MTEPSSSPRVRSVLRVPATGGNPERLVSAEEGERIHSPQMLPDGRTLLLHVGSERYGIRERSSRRRWIPVSAVFSSRVARMPRYVDTGHLVYALEDDLLAVPFDVDALEDRRRPRPRR